MLGLFCQPAQFDAICGAEQRLEPYSIWHAEECARAARAVASLYRYDEKFVGFFLFRNPEYRDVLADHLKSQGMVEESKKFKSFRASFAHWRYETVAFVMKQLLYISPVVVGYFHAALYGKVQDASLLSGVAKAVACCEFWRLRGGY